jgi:hypothetical protein
VSPAKADRPTAVLTANDLTAIGLERAQADPGTATTPAIETTTPATNAKVRETAPYLMMTSLRRRHGDFDINESLNCFCTLHYWPCTSLGLSIDRASA